MNASDNIKPKTIRLAILMALADGGIATIDDLQSRMDEPRAKIASNVHPTMAEGLIKRLRDDVTSLPAYQITPKGREYLGSFAGGKAEAVESVVKESLITDAEHVELKRIEAVALDILEDSIPGFTAEVVAQKDAEIARLHEQYEDACQLVARMHSAAMGMVCAPKLGVVEDVAEVRRMLNDYHRVDPVGYVIHRSNKRHSSIESAQRTAKAQAKKQGQARRVFALVPAGVAIPGSEWRPA